MEYLKRLLFTPVKFADLGYNSWHLSALKFVFLPEKQITVTKVLDSLSEIITNIFQLDYILHRNCCYSSYSLTTTWLLKIRTSTVKRDSVRLRSYNEQKNVQEVSANNFFPISDHNVRHPTPSKPYSNDRFHWWAYLLLKLLMKSLQYQCRIYCRSMFYEFNSWNGAFKERYI